jgi:hypothetical protein
MGVVGGGKLVELFRGVSFIRLIWWYLQTSSNTLIKISLLKSRKEAGATPRRELLFARKHYSPLEMNLFHRENN